jgi:leucyl aminopeptidase
VASIEGKDGALLAPGHGLPSTAAVHLEAMLADLDAKGSAGEVGRFVVGAGGQGEAVSRSPELGKTVTCDALRAAAANAVRAVGSKRARRASPCPRPT